MMNGDTRKVQENLFLLLTSASNARIQVPRISVVTCDDAEEEEEDGLASRREEEEDDDDDDDADLLEQ